jgi:nucleotide-binding universal stress UspA family protein/CBS domain-containing protein
MQVKDVMTRRFRRIEADATLHEVAEPICKGDVQPVVVSHGAKIVGTLTPRELARSVLTRGLDPRWARVSDVMLPAHTSCLEDQPLQDVLHVMRTRDVRHLVAHNREGAPTGILALTDVPVLERQSNAHPSQLHLHPGGALRDILVALDGSGRAERVLSVVVPLARQADATLTLLRAIPPSHVPDSIGNILTEHARLEALTYLNRLQVNLGRGELRVSCALPEAEPAESVVDWAQRHPEGMIAMTTHGRGRGNGTSFGRVADEVVRRAPCPVLLIPAVDDFAL